MYNEFAQYYENLLRAQYRVSEIIQQKLPRGTIREDFLREIILKRNDFLRGKKGIVSKCSIQSGECDLILYESSATVNPIGDLILIEPKNCKLILEIKSNASGTDIKKTNKNFELIKSIDSDCHPLCGLFCYNTVLKKRTILNRFGWIYDNDIKGWKEAVISNFKYPHIDFIICIASLEEDESCIENQFFLIKDNILGKFTLRSEYPIIKNFLGITDNL
jgi:hypothetical protein